MAAEGDVIAFIFTGDVDIIPQNATHVYIHESVSVIPVMAFYRHRCIVELICHMGVKRIEREAFFRCPSLLRVIISGVEVVERGAFMNCRAVTYVECEKLERIGERAFTWCISLTYINLPSVKVVERAAFLECFAMIDATLGNQLESISPMVFKCCRSLERITIPLKGDLITDDDIFQWCVNLKHVNLAGGAIHETIAAFQLNEWTNDVKDEIDSIGRILINTAPGGALGGDPGGKAIAISGWITRVLRKIIDYKAQHRELVVEAAPTLMVSLPSDVVVNNVLPFLELPPHTFDGETSEEGDGNGSNIYNTPVFIGNHVETDSLS